MTPTTDRSVVLAVILMLGTATLLLILGALYLINNDHEVPGEAWALATGGVAALAAMLSSTRSSPPGPPAAPVPPLIDNAHGLPPDR